MGKKSKSLNGLKNMIEENFKYDFINQELTPAQYFDRLYWIFRGIMDYVGIAENEEIIKINEKIKEAINKVGEMEKLVEAIKNLLKREV